MGWARTLLLGDIGNRLDIADTERDIETVRSALRENWNQDRTQQQEIDQLKQENQELEICLASLIKMLERKGTLSADEVAKLVTRTEL